MFIKDEEKTATLMIISAIVGLLLGHVAHVFI